MALNITLAMILSFIESKIPPLVAIPGIKIGLANIGHIPEISVRIVRLYGMAALRSMEIKIIYMGGRLIIFTLKAKEGMSIL